MPPGRLVLLTCLLAAGFQAAALARPRLAHNWPRAIASSIAKKPSAGGTRSAVIRQPPFGISIEYPLLERALGPGPCPSDGLITTFRELGSPSLRIGGDSQDLAGPTPAYHYFIPPSFWTVLGCFARETKAQITVGLNFGDGTLADNLAMISAAEQLIPASQLSFSLGNEPDIYFRSHVLHNEPSFRVPAYRPTSWSATDYAREWISRRAMLGPIRLEGPDLAASGWRTAVARLLRADPPDQINIHFYPATACPRASQATPKLLLSKHASVDLISQLSWLLTAARAVHRPAVISETNSASCGGKPGVSNSPVASIWAVRFVEAALLAGFEQVRFHTAGTSYDAFVFNPNGTVTRRPLATALSFIHRWIPVASRITSTVTNPQIFAATITHHGTTSMIVTSFANHTLDLPIAVAGARKRLTTDTLTTRTTIEVPSSLQVVAHQAQLRLAPNTVVAFKTR